MSKKPTQVDRIFHALGDPTRRSMLEAMSDKPVSISQLAIPLNITLVAVVQHIKLLEASGLVRSEKNGRTRTCRLEPAGLSVAGDWIAERRALWEKRLSKLGDLLAEDEKE